ncbi:polysaccharide biosynthesis protein [Paenisporosarcina sp. NPDC076898]|uniref:polysaccharide biosynthesis protein n=1 Tax=unclassified Paenisporosarcina TaxID=2642018 RepID=UPI003D00C9EB
MYTNSTILVTGGTGSWGMELIRQLLRYNPRKIIVFSRNENSQVLMRREFEDSRLNFCIGDIRDREALSTACKSTDIVFHLAALKHVPICEDHPLESIKTNIIGTQNVIEASIENNVRKVIYVSTDKAADPVNSYGMTKALGEKLIIHANQKDSATKFICVRGGNVLGSSGSVIPLFKQQIKEKNHVLITDKKMTRYFVTPQSAIETLLKASELGNGGEIYVMHMDACKILDLAEVLIERYGNEDTKIIEVGARPGEKIHEVLIGKNEEEIAKVYDKDLIIISPTISKKLSGQLPSILTDTTRKLLNKTEVKDLLTIGGFLD